MFPDNFTSVTEAFNEYINHTRNHFTNDSSNHGTNISSDLFKLDKQSIALFKNYRKTNQLNKQLLFRYKQEVCYGK